MTLPTTAQIMIEPQSTGLPVKVVLEGSTISHVYRCLVY
jgi:hypothetical protein